MLLRAERPDRVGGRRPEEGRAQLKAKHPSRVGWGGARGGQKQSPGVQVGGGRKGSGDALWEDGGADSDAGVQEDDGGDDSGTGAQEDDGGDNSGAGA